MINFLELTRKFGSRKAIISRNREYSYDELHRRSDGFASVLLEGKTDLEEERVAFLADPSFEYTSIQWGIWKAGGIAVPLCVLHPLSSIKHVLSDTTCRHVIIERKFQEFLKPLIDELGIQTIVIDDVSAKHNTKLPDLAPDRRAMILYTSGTTNLPKGVVTTHENIEAQITSLVEAWGWNKDDHILNILPLHHVHGIINVMSCALWVGGCCEFLPKFDAAKVWAIFSIKKVNLFMAVPTIYYKLIQYWDDAELVQQNVMSESLRHFRLMVSGSAALPVSVLEKWKKISGLTLLERYGMTEIGMALSNPYEGERRAGHVGLPLPGVEIKLVDENGKAIHNGKSGEIYIKSPSVFLEYWNNKNATDDSFDPEGWFRTGDVAQINEGYYQILGRTSVDIIKSGGYKISALEIEEVIRKYHDVNDCGVVGIANDEWGEIVCAGIVASSNDLDLESLKKWLRNELPGYKLPRKLKLLKDLPRNTIGKVTKKELKKMFTN